MDHPDQKDQKERDRARGRNRDETDPRYSEQASPMYPRSEPAGDEPSSQSPTYGSARAQAPSPSQRNARQDHQPQGWPPQYDNQQQGAGTRVYTPLSLPSEHYHPSSHQEGSGHARGPPGPPLSPPGTQPYPSPHFIPPGPQTYGLAYSSDRTYKVEQPAQYGAASDRTYKVEPSAQYGTASYPQSYGSGASQSYGSSSGSQYASQPQYSSNAQYGSNLSAPPYGGPQLAYASPSSGPGYGIPQGIHSTYEMDRDRGGYHGQPKYEDGEVPNYGREYGPGNSQELRKDSAVPKPKAEKTNMCRHEGCNKAFATSNDLERHGRSVHNEDGQYYQCREQGCPEFRKFFARRDNFTDHLKRMHKFLNLTDDRVTEMAADWVSVKRGDTYTHQGSNIIIPDT